METLKNINYSLEEYAVNFTFDGGCADLQLPNTGDSQHFINGDDYDLDNEEHKYILEQLISRYFSDFDDIDLAAASALLGSNVIHIEPVNRFYVAFTDTDEEALIKDSSVKSYYNKKSLFDVVDIFDLQINECEFLCESDLINAAKQQLAA